MRNKRQHAMFGLASLALAQRLMLVWAEEAEVAEEVEQQQQQQQEWGYRQWLEEAVRWRQASEPADPVWWVDRMPTQAFKDGWVTWPPHHTTLSHHHTTLSHHHTTLPHHHSASYGVTAWRDLAWRGLACLVVDWLGLA